MTELDEWLPALQAARRLSERVGFVVTTDDLRQMKRRGVLTKSLSIDAYTSLYNTQEIDAVAPPKKEIHPYATFDDYVASQRAKWRAKRRTHQPESL